MNRIAAAAVGLAALLLGATAVFAQPSVRVLVAYHSETGHTRRMAEAVAAGVGGVEGAEAVVKSIGEVAREDLLAADAVALGSPVHMGDAAVEVRQAVRRWAVEYGFWDSRGLRDKVGATFAAGAFPSNGKEFTMLGLGQTLLQFGMVLVSPYGSVGASATTHRPDPGVDDAELEIARGLGRRLAETAARFKRGAAAP